MKRIKVNTEKMREENICYTCEGKSIKKRRKDERCVMGKVEKLYLRNKEGKKDERIWEEKIP